MSSFYDAIKKAVVCTPNLNPDNAAYDRGVLGPYAEIEKMAAAAEGAPSDDDVQTALGLLKTIFDTKRVEEQEQRERFEEILGPIDKVALSPFAGAS